jgi:acyl dehydratase
MKNRFSTGDSYDFGTVTFSEQDIIEFALKNDPLPFHTNKSVAENHLFKALVCSGQQPFHHFYVKHWIPIFTSSVLCGISVTNWNFQKPVYAGTTVHCKVTIIHLQIHEHHNTITVTWKFEFTNAENIPLQELEMRVLHQNA